MSLLWAFKGLGYLTNDFKGPMCRWTFSHLVSEVYDSNVTHVFVPNTIFPGKIFVCLKFTCLLGESSLLTGKSNTPRNPPKISL